MRRMPQATSSSAIPCVAVRVWDHNHPKFRASYITRYNGFSTIPNRIGSDGQSASGTGTGGGGERSEDYAQMQSITIAIIVDIQCVGRCWTDSIWSLPERLLTAGLKLKQRQ